MRISTKRIFFLLLFIAYSLSGFAIFGFKKHKTETSKDTISVSNSLSEQKVPVFCGKYSNNPTVDSLLCFAFYNLGKPYCGGACGPNAFDCSGFTSYVYSQFGYKLNRSSGSQTSNGAPVEKEQLAPGDLVFFKGRNSHASRIGHVGIVASIKDDGSFTFIHASNSTGISHDNSTAPYYLNRYVTACRVISPESLTPRNPFLKRIEPLPVVAHNRDEESENDENEANHKAKIKKFRVKRGQTLFSIAEEYNCSVDDLKEWNKLERNKLYLGQKLVVHLPEPSEEIEPIAVEKPITDISTDLSATREDTELNEGISSEHSVSKGESLLIISKKYNCTIKQLKEWNKLQSTKLQVGQKLIVYLPESGEINTASSRNEKRKTITEKARNNELETEIASTTEHEVAKGESLILIAKKYNCTVSELKEWNKIKGNKVQLGQKLVLFPTEGQSSAIASTNKPEKPVKVDAEAMASTEHEVEKGESLLLISKKYKCTINELKEWNKLESTKLQVGQKLVIHPNQSNKQESASAVFTKPAKESKFEEEPVLDDLAENEHEVTKGESLLLISKKYNCSIKQLKDWNKLENSKIQAGQKLKIYPKEEESASTELSPKKPIESRLAEARKELLKIEDGEKAANEHEVEKGETLFAIASKYGCTINDLKAWNQLEKSTVFPGQKLKVSGANGEKPKAVYHTITKGESLYVLADKYQTTIKALQEINDLESPEIKIGQRIRVK